MSARYEVLVFTEKHTLVGEPVLVDDLPSAKKLASEQCNGWGRARYAVIRDVVTGLSTGFWGTP